MSEKYMFPTCIWGAKIQLFSELQQTKASYLRKKTLNPTIPMHSCRFFSRHCPKKLIKTFGGSEENNYLCSVLIDKATTKP